MQPKGFRTNWMPCDSKCSSTLHTAWNCDFQIFGPLKKVLKGHMFMGYDDSGSTPWNSLHMEYMGLFIIATLVQVPLVDFSSCHNGASSSRFQLCMPHIWWTTLMVLSAKVMFRWTSHDSIIFMTNNTSVNNLLHFQTIWSDNHVHDFVCWIQSLCGEEKEVKENLWPLKHYQNNEVFVHYISHFWIHSLHFSSLAQRYSIQQNLINSWSVHSKYHTIQRTWRSPTSTTQFCVLLNAVN